MADKKDTESNKKTNWKAGIGGIVAIFLILYFLLPSPAPRKQNQLDVGVTSNVQAQAPAETYTKVYKVGSEPVRVTTPYGYKVSYRWGYAPLDTRTNASPEWLDADNVPSNIQGGQMVQWREWRLSSKYEGPKTAEVVYTFTKVF